MKHNHQCTKCGSRKLIRVPILPGEGPHIAVGSKPMHTVPLTQFVCGTCGFIETWVANEEDLAELSAQYGSAEQEQQSTGSGYANADHQ